MLAPPLASVAADGDDDDEEEEEEEEEDEEEDGNAADEIVPSSLGAGARQGVLATTAEWPEGD